MLLPRNQFCVALGVGDTTVAILFTGFGGGISGQKRKAVTH